MIQSSDLSNRKLYPNEPEPRGAAEVHAAVERVKGERPEPLEARIAKARSLAPPSDPLVDPESWVKGRDAALKAIEAP